MAEESRPCCVRRGGTSGFTMIEIIVALVVLGVASWILISMFRGSLDLAGSSSHQIVAVQLGEAQLQDIVRHPEGYLWYRPDSPDAAMFDIKEHEDDPPAGASFHPPSIAPGIARAFRIHEERYASYKWKAHGRFPRDELGGWIPDPAYLEVILEVCWQEGGRDQVLALSGAVPLAVLPEPAQLPEPAAAPETTDEAVTEEVE